MAYPGSLIAALGRDLFHSPFVRRLNTPVLQGRYNLPTD